MTTPVLKWRFLLSPTRGTCRGPRQSRDSKKKLSEMTMLLDDLRSTLTTEQQKEKLEQIENCRLSLIALSEKDAYIEGFKLSVRMTTEIYADSQQLG